MLLIGQLLFAAATALYTLWLVRSLARVVWHNGLKRRVTTAEEALRIAGLPFGRLLDCCVLRPLDALLTRLC